jgi:transcriptional regulator with XRE-family HTH domain
VPRPAHSPTTVAFGEAVRAFREERGISQERLADLSGLQRTYIGGVERGERNLGLVNIFVIAYALDTPASELIARAEALVAR